MKLVRSLPFLLAPLSALALTFQDGAPTRERRPPQEQERVRGNPDEDELPPGIGNRDVGALDIFGRPTRNAADTIAERIQGGWQLTGMELLGSNPAGRTTNGFLNIGRNYLSFEVHASWEGDTKSIEYDIHNAFTAEYTLDTTGRLLTRSVVGSFIEEQTGRLRWETFGFPREFFVTETAKELVLTYDNGKSRLTFRPRPPQMVGRRDIFGRRELAEPKDRSLSVDIFGRKSTESTGVRDIFGRLVPPEKDGDKEGEEAGGGDKKKTIDPRETPPPGGGGR